MEFRMEDCRVALENGILIAENSRICRRFAARPEGLFPLEVRDLRSGFSFTSDQTDIPVIPSGFGVGESPELHLAGGADGKGFTAVLSYQDGDCSAEFHIFLAPGLPFYSLFRIFKGQWGFPKEKVPVPLEVAGNSCADGEDVLDAVSLPRGHWDLETVMLFDQTDYHDVLARTFREPVYPSGKNQERGNLFLFLNRINGQGILFVKESPTHLNVLNQYPADLSFSDLTVRLTGSGLPNGGSGRDFMSFGSTIGVGNGERIYSEYKRFVMAQWTFAPEKSFSMSNTWGDRNQDLAVCDAFVRKEIDTAAEIGVDIVQIDDGWQKGITINSARQKGGVWEGYYATDPDFWKPDPEKFPQGLKPVSAYAASKGVKLGLWFSPDSSRDFRNWKRDAVTLVELWRRYGICCFKLDGVKLRSKAAERNYFSLLARVTAETKGAVSFTPDITVEDRAGYLWQKQYGTLFVENRYTAFSSYYPHNTLRNLWTLSRFFPARKFQFELLNNRLRRECYIGDPLAPEKVDICYEFAAVMFANPLFWMELQNLAPEDRKALQKIVRVYKDCREDLAAAEVLPIGRMPCGDAITGFQADCGDGRGYLLLFREPLAPEAGMLHIRSVAVPASLRPLASNLPASGYQLECDGEWLQLSMNSPGSFLLLRYSK